MRERLTGLLLMMLLATGAVAAPDRSLRPEARQAVAAPDAQPPGAGPQAETQAGPQAGLERWITGFRPRARAAGISDATLNAALRGARYDADVIRRDRNQAEFTKTIWEYLDTAVSDLRIANGRAALARRDATLTQIEARYGVEKEIVTAIWGLESAYGTFRGTVGTIDALATLAFDARRADFFEAELIHALHILQAGDTTPA